MRIGFQQLLNGHLGSKPALVDCHAAEGTVRGDTNVSRQEFLATTASIRAIGVHRFRAEGGNRVPQNESGVIDLDGSVVHQAAFCARTKIPVTSFAPGSAPECEKNREHCLPLAELKFIASILSCSTIISRPFSKPSIYSRRKPRISRRAGKCFQQGKQTIVGSGLGE